MTEKENSNLEMSFPVETPRKKNSNGSKDPRLAIAESIVKTTDHSLPTILGNANIIAVVSIIMGPLGVHDFVCGNKRNGIIKLVCTIIGITAFISVIWNIIDLYKIGNGTYSTQNGIKHAPCPWCKKVGLVMAAVNIAVFLIFLFQILKFLSVMSKHLFYT